MIDMHNKLYLVRANAVSDALLAAPLAEQFEVREALDRQRTRQNAMGPVPAMVSVVAALFGMRPS